MTDQALEAKDVKLSDFSKVLSTILTVIIIDYFKTFSTDRYSSQIYVLISNLEFMTYLIKLRER